jgi:flavin-dependent dehydrogenase
MKIAIAGAGIAGAYLYRLLQNESGGEIQICGHKHMTKCGISPCAWGATAGFNELLEQVDLKPDDYILQHLDHFIIDGTEIKVDIVTFNKPRLISDLLKDATVYYTQLNTTKYDRLIDATGTSRAYLPPIKNDLVLRCAQSRVRSDKPLGNWINIGYIGYAWCFPLSDNAYHVGYGSINDSSFHALSGTCKIWKQDSHTVCACEGKIRITCPHYSTPFVDNIAIQGGSVPVWGIGEAIGCVGSLAGDGIVPGMKSAQLLMQHRDDPEKYTHSILHEFKWMKNERHVVDKIYRGEKPGPGDAWIFKNNAKRAGMRIGLKQALIILKRLGNSKVHIENGVFSKKLPY